MRVVQDNQSQLLLILPDNSTVCFTVKGRPQQDLSRQPAPKTMIRDNFGAKVMRTLFPH